MKTIWTEESKALRQLIEERSSIRWFMGERPSEYDPRTYDDGPIQDSVVFHVKNSALTAADKNYCICQKYEHVTPEEFIRICAERFPKKQKRTAAEVVAEIEKLTEELKGLL